MNENVGGILEFVYTTSVFREPAEPVGTILTLYRMELPLHRTPNGSVGRNTCLTRSPVELALCSPMRRPCLERAAHIGILRLIATGISQSLRCACVSTLRRNAKFESPAIATIVFTIAAAFGSTSISITNDRSILTLSNGNFQR